MSFSATHATLGITRTFSQFSEAMNEVRLARVYGGLHFMTADAQRGHAREEGRRLRANFFQPRSTRRPASTRRGGSLGAPARHHGSERERVGAGFFARQTRTDTQGMKGIRTTVTPWMHRLIPDRRTSPGQASRSMTAFRKHPTRSGRLGPSFWVVPRLFGRVAKPDDRRGRFVRHGGCDEHHTPVNWGSRSGEGHPWPSLAPSRMRRPPAPGRLRRGGRRGRGKRRIELTRGGRAARRRRSPEHRADPDGRPAVDTLWAMPTVNAELVTRGISFENGYVQPAVLPEPGEHPDRSVLPLERGLHQPERAAIRGFLAFDDRSTVATWLHDASYRTAMLGKYFNGYEEPYVPPGWDRWFATYVNGAFYRYRVTDDGLIKRYLTGTARLRDERSCRGRPCASSGPRRPACRCSSTSHHTPHEPATAAPGDEHAFSDLSPWRPPSYDEADVSGQARAHPQPVAGRRQAGRDRTRSVAGNTARCLPWTGRSGTSSKPSRSPDGSRTP